MNNLRYITVFPLLALLFAACQHEDLGKDPHAGSGQQIAFRASSLSMMDDAAVTRSLEQQWDSLVLFSGKGETLTMAVTAYDGTRLDEDRSAMTRGVLVTNNNLGQEYGVDADNGIGVLAYWSESLSTPYLRDYLTYDGSKAEDHQWTAHGQTYYWPKTGSLDFWAWAPNEIDASRFSATRTFSSDAVVSADHTSISFHYDLGQGGGTSDAVKQPDLIFSRFNQNTTAALAPVVEYTFHHALSGVEFRISDPAGGTLSSISLKDVTRSGDCVFTPSSSSAFSWTLGDATATYTQTFGTGGNGMAVSTDAVSPTLVTPDESGTAFMMIPQSLSGRKIQVVLNRGGADVAFTGDIPTTTYASWEAGKTYVYTIVIDEGLEISVSDVVSMDATVKSDPLITNEGTSPCYVRATMTGCWVNSSGAIVMPWKETDSQGTFLNLPRQDWFLASDGFYYYKKPVPGGQAAKLFDTYTLSQPTSYPGELTLQMDIDAQAVAYDAQKNHVRQAWGDTVAGQLELLPAAP